ncbi:argininosuccinate lyase, partial [Candidatus Pacearchaeota archaeon]|nr:argininosuccinate lyase [Candidatus Pacearchaeota archaeon]
MTFGRIKKKPAEDYIRHILTQRLEDYKPQFYAQMLVHRAHVVMLYEQGIIKKEEAAQILVGLSAIEKGELNDLGLEPHSDLYMATEKKLIELVGDVGGKMHIGRSRNDLSATSTRMCVREKISEVIESFIELKKTLLNLSEENIETIMPGYTHGQQAQPVVLAH